MPAQSTDDNDRLEREAVKWRKSLLFAFKFARQGAVRSLRLQRNLRIHWTAGTAVLVWNLCVRPSTVLVTVSILTIALVMSIELLNTAVEHLTDLATAGNYHELAKWAKDASAAAVLVSSVGAIAVAVLLLADTWPWHFLLLTRANLIGAAQSAVGIVLLIVWGVTSGLRQVERRKHHDN
ncbi:diacylglycerol kinase family protein [Alicyclobacillus curvatus]|nr:diacylglycerol kinase family protein [Alicyclobacillus curvatus]